MKSVCSKNLLILVGLLILSCNEKSSGNNDFDLLCDSDFQDTESTDTDEDSSVFSCIDEWKEAPFIESPLEYYDFSIVKTEYSWDWEKDGEIKTIKIAGPRGDRLWDILVGSDGSIYMTGAFTDDAKEDLYRGFLSVYKPDGKLVRYSWDKDKFGEVFKIIEDQNTGDIKISMAIEDPEGYDPTNPDWKRRKTILSTLHKDGTWTHVSWKVPGYLFCMGMMLFDGEIFAACEYLIDSDDVGNSILFFKINEKSAKYIEFPFSDYRIRPLTLRFDNNAFSLLYGIQAIVTGEDFLNGDVLNISKKDLCVQENYIFPLGIGLITKHDFIDGKLYGIGYKKEEIKDENDSTIVRTAIIYKDYLNGGKEILNIGIKKFVNETAQDTSFDDFIESKYENIIYFAGKTYGNLTGGETEINSGESDVWRRNPFVFMVDGDGRYYLKQFSTAILGDSPQIIKEDKDYLYLGGSYVSSKEVDFVINSFVHKIPKSILIEKENSFDVSEFLWIEGIK